MIFLLSILNKVPDIGITFFAVKGLPSSTLYFDFPNFCFFQQGIRNAECEETDSGHIVHFVSVINMFVRFHFVCYVILSDLYMVSEKVIFFVVIPCYELLNLHFISMRGKKSK